MPHVVTQSCCADASCVVACPVNCIHPAPGEPGFADADMLFVDPATCVGCGACVTACPVGAIVPASALSPEQLPFVALNADYFSRSPHPDRSPVALVPEQRRLRCSGPFRVAVIGAGPAGLYTADELLKHPEIQTVDVFDRLNTPHGLVRHGVAPDHQSTKRVTELFRAIEKQPGFHYVLGVDVGADVSLAQLQSRYHAVVYAVGASTDRRLSIPGEDLAGSLAAVDVVGWYNGHPDREHLAVPLEHERAVIVGNGNVALDIARILTHPMEHLRAATDIAPRALNQLATSAIREVVILGRRGPAQASFTVPELLGIANLPDTDVIVDADPDLLYGNDARSKILSEIADRAPNATTGRRRIVLKFISSPTEILGHGAQTRAVRVTRNDLVTTATGAIRAVPTDQHIDLATGLVIRSIGYRGTPLPDLPFNDATGTIPNDHGRVRPGVYVVGWIKRGPRGFIGTNKTDAQDTVAQLLDDLNTTDQQLLDPTQTTEQFVAQYCSHATDLDGWRAIDTTEGELGTRMGRPRVKIVDPHTQATIAATTPRPHHPRIRPLLKLFS